VDDSRGSANSMVRQRADSQPTVPGRICNWGLAPYRSVQDVHVKAVLTINHLRTTRLYLSWVSQLSVPHPRWPPPASQVAATRMVCGFAVSPRARYRCRPTLWAGDELAATKFAKILDEARPSHPSRKLFVEAQAATCVPSTKKRPTEGCAPPYGSGKKLARNLGLRQSITVLREHRGHPLRLVNPEPNKPAVQ
jgi:hypothetical protein